MNLYNLFAVLSLDTSKYDKGLKSSEKSASSFASKLGIGFKNVGKVMAGVVSGVVAVGTALAATAVKFINYGDEIDKSSQKLGLSAEAYQKWSLATEMAGGDVATLQTGIRQLNTYIENLSKGQGDALLTLNELGIGYEDFMDMSFDDQLKAIVTAMQGVESQTDKVRIAQELFGSRAYQELLPLLNQEQGSIDELFTSYENLGIVIKDDVIEQSAELNDMFSLLTSSAKSFGMNIVSDTFPALKTLTEGLQGLLTTGDDESVQKFVDGISMILESLIRVAPQFVGKVSDIIIGVLDGLTQGDTLTTLVNELANVVNAILVKLVDMSPTLLNAAVQLFVSLIGALANIDWETLVPDLVTAIIDAIFALITSGEFYKNLFKLGGALIRGIVEGLKAAGSSIWDNLTELVTSEDARKKFVNMGIRIVNGIIEGLNKLGNFTIPGLKIGPYQVWGDTHVKLFTIPKIKLMAQGGMLDEIMSSALNDFGTLYGVGESGAEIVAQGSRGTGVANVMQIQEADYNAMEAYGLPTRTDLRNGVSAIVNAMSSNNPTQTQMINSGRSLDLASVLLQIIDNELKNRGHKTLSRVTSF